MKQSFARNRLLVFLSLVVLAGLMTVTGFGIPVATANQDVELQFFVDDMGDGSLMLSILLRNNRQTNIGGVNVFGELPLGVVLIQSWTGENRTENFGRVTDGWISWVNPEVTAGQVQGPFRYRVRITPGYTVNIRARATWIGPGGSEVWAGPVTLSGPTLAEGEPLPTPAPNVFSPTLYKYRVEWTEAREDCNHTRLFGTVEDGNGLFVKTWNDWGNESFSVVGLDHNVGVWERYIGPGARPGVWYAQVVDPVSRGPISPVSTVAFVGDSCSARPAVQEIWIHFKRN